MGRTICASHRLVAEWWPFYWITSSAVANSVSGMVRPSALAVFRLRTVSYLAGACTERSAGLVFLRMMPV